MRLGRMQACPSKRIQIQAVKSMHSTHQKWKVHTREVSYVRPARPPRSLKCRRRASADMGLPAGVAREGAKRRTSSCADMGSGCATAGVKAEGGVEYQQGGQVMGGHPAMTCYEGAWTCMLQRIAAAKQRCCKQQCASYKAQHAYLRARQTHLVR